MGAGERRGGLLPLTRERMGSFGLSTGKTDFPSKGTGSYTAMDRRAGCRAERANDPRQAISDIHPGGAAPKEGEVELYASPLTKSGWVCRN